MHHFKEAAGIDLPDAVLVKRFGRPSHILGRYNISDKDRLWWHQPPDGVEPTPPEEIQAVRTLHANQLIAHLDSILANSRNVVHSEILQLECNFD